MLQSRIGLPIVLAGIFFASAAPSRALAETVLITGANAGIGLEFTKQYADRGATRSTSSQPSSKACRSTS
jgi:hypothetical protein